MRFVIHVAEQAAVVVIVVAMLAGLVAGVLGVSPRRRLPESMTGVASEPPLRTSKPPLPTPRAPRAPQANGNLGPPTVNYRVITDALPATVSVLLGDAWTASWVRSRLGRVIETDKGAYRMQFVGNHLDVAITRAEECTVLTMMVTQAHDTRASLPGTFRALDINRLTRDLVLNALRSALRLRGHHVGIRASLAEEEPLRP